MSDAAIGRPKILVFGEVLIDLFMNNSSDIKGSPIFKGVGLPGGAPCNVAANLVKCGSSVEFVSAFGDDLVGEELYQMLKERGVGLEYCLFPKDSSTPMVAVYSDKDGQNTFRIYMQESVYSSLNVDSFDWSVLDMIQWVHFGSVLMAPTNTREITGALVRCASENGSIVSYDINIRPNILSSEPEDSRFLVEILHHVDLLKVSDEDFAWIKENIRPDLSEPGDLLEYGCSVIAWTHGAKGSTIITKEQRIEIPSIFENVKDSTGAGDAFTAGLIHFLAGKGVRTKQQIQQVVDNEDLLRGAGMFAASLSGEIIAQQGALPRIV